MAVNLRRLRHDKELTQEELADLAGISARYVGKIERANVSPSVGVLGRLATAFDVDPCELIRQGKAHVDAPCSRPTARPFAGCSPHRFKTSISHLSQPAVLPGCGGDVAEGQPSSTLPTAELFPDFPASSIPWDATWPAGDDTSSSPRRKPPKS